VLIYHRTDFTFAEPEGTIRHVVAQMTPVEQDRAAESVRRFVTEDVAALDSGNMVPTVEVRFPEQPLTRLSPQGSGWWPAPSDTSSEAGGAFDSVIVIWDPRAVDQDTGEPIWLGSAAGLTPAMGTGPTYNAVIIEAAALYNHRNVFKHEWGHSILFYFDAAGTAPRPTVTNHAGAGTYVHCPTGEPYVWVDETLDNPVPNSIYSNSSGFTHDYYSGTVATADQPDRCLGITPLAWATGGPVSKPARKLPPFPPRPPRRLVRAAPVTPPPATETDIASSQGLLQQPRPDEVSRQAKLSGGTLTRRSLR
jgi:hypothetical protein